MTAVFEGRLLNILLNKYMLKQRMYIRSGVTMLFVLNLFFSCIAFTGCELKFSHREIKI